METAETTVDSTDTAGAVSMSPPAPCSEYVRYALEYIIAETRWAGKFPRQSHERIREVCTAVLSGSPLPFDPRVIPNNAVRGAAEPRTLDGLVGDSKSGGCR